MTKIDKDTDDIPSPPHPLRREEPLPSQSVKPKIDDPAALQRVEQLLASDTYRRADLDVGFLDRDDVRGARLQLDYLKPELHLHARGIKHTIVVFGGTRIPEPEAARRKVLARRHELEKSPDNPDLKRRVEIAERILKKSRYYDVARELGQIVGGSGKGPGDCRVTMMTGGGPGIMEAANRGAFDVGAKSIGLNITLPHEQFPNPYVSEDLCFSVRYFAIRKLHFLLRASALVAFPGGFGTLDEVFETLNLVQSRKIRPLPVILVGERFWRQAFDPDFLVDEGVIDFEDRELFWYAETAEDIWEQINRWHLAASGSTLCQSDVERPVFER